MGAITKLQKILLKNYYPTFLVSLYEYEEINLRNYDANVIYKGVDYLENKLSIIEKESKKIIFDTRPIFNEAKSDIFVKLQNLNSKEEKLFYLTNTINLFNIAVTQLQKDILIDSPNSNYYSQINISKKFVSFDQFFSDTQNNLENLEENNDIELEVNSHFDVFYLDYFNVRTKMLGYLPTALLAIANSFMSFLEYNIDAINNIYNTSKIKWSGNNSKLGFIMGTLASLGYIDVPKKSDGEINYKQFARELNKIFNCDFNADSLARYLSVDSDKCQETRSKFKSKGFDIPHIKDVS